MTLLTSQDLILAARDVFLLMEDCLLDFLVLDFIHILTTLLNGFQSRKLLQNHGILTNMATVAKSQIYLDKKDGNNVIFSIKMSNVFFEPPFSLLYLQ